MTIETYLARVHANGARFRSPRGVRGTLTTVDVGRLRLPTGRLSVRDPHAIFDAAVDSDMVFSEVPPGNYEVVASLVKYEDLGIVRGAAVTVIVREDIPVKWRSSAVDDATPSAFGVDAGQGCVLDADFLSGLRRLQDEGEEGYLDELAYSTEPLHRYPDRDQFSMLVFDCGMGDGAYRVHAGLDPAGDVVRLVVDLELVRDVEWI